MDTFKNILHLTRAFFEVVNVRLRYNEHSIADHFRKQGATIGEGCLFAIHKLGNEPFLVTIGNHVFITEDVFLHTHDGGGWILNQEDPDLWVFGKIVIEDNCLIGTRAHIMPNVRIGHDSIVGAGSVVIADVPPNSIVMGIPARVIGSTIRYKEKCRAIWEQQRPPGWAKMNEPQRMKALRKHLAEIEKETTPLDPGMKAV